MSILKSKHNGWLSDGTRTPFTGGGGGAPGPSTSYNTNIPEYARPYVTNMLGATQNQLFTTSGGSPATEATYDAEGNVLTPATAAGAREITGFKPYQPYSSNVNDYFAGPSPLMGQAYQAASQLRTPEQIGAGSRLAEQGGLGFLSTTQPAGMYGQMGAGLGLEAAGAGSQFARQATDPSAVQQYMSPYMQNVVDYQKSQALRDFQMGQPMMQARAVGQGAFGGNRLALQQSEAQRGLMSQLQGIQATGTQKAFEDAQRQMQYGAGLGLQGLQAGMQGAGVGLQGVGAQQAGFGGATQAGSALGNLGGQQLGAQTGIINLQNQLGLQQQQQEQAKINQSIQDYATQQQYPLMQLGFMSNMLRGLPMQATTTQSYQAVPSNLNQGLGVLAGAAGARQAGLFAEGGTIKGLASGGVTGYANRGMVQANPSSEAVQGIRQKLEMMPPKQLQQVAQTSSSEEVRTMALEVLREKQIREQAEAQAQQSIMQDRQAMPTPVSEGVGLPAAPAGAMDTLNAASGGIVAFAGPDGSQVDLDEDEAKRLQQDFLARQKYVDFAKQQREGAGIGAPKAALGEFYAKEQADIANAEKQARGYGLMDFGLNLATQTGPLAYAAGRAGQAALPGMMARQEKIRGRGSEAAKGLAEVAEGERLMKLGDITGGNAMFDKAEERLSKEKVAGMKTPGNMTAYANNYLAEKTAAGDTRDPATIRREGMDQYMYLYGQAGPRAAVAATTAETNLFDKARDNVDSSLAKNFNSPENRQLRTLQKADKKNNTSTANTYLQELYRKEEQRMKGGVPSGGGGGGGGGKAPLPPGFQRDKS
jgi:hypothetical protein